MNETRISIVTPSYNQSRFVRETIESILSQKYSNLEYIVIDGGSTDGSAEIIKEYESQLAYFVSEEDNGHGDALNKGFKKSTGEIMGWLNSDDKYLPWTFETVAAIFDENPDVNWIAGTQGQWNDKGALISSKNVYKNIHDFVKGDFAWIQQETVFWRRPLWEKAGGIINENFRLMVDGELWTRFFLLDELYHAHCLLGGYRMHQENRAQRHHQECLSEMARAIDIMKSKATPILRSRTDIYPALGYNKESGLWTKLGIRKPDSVAAQHSLRRPT